MSQRWLARRLPLPKRRSPSRSRGLSNAATVERRNIGLVKLFRLPAALEIALAVVLMDYTFYLWHVATHKIGFLWRFHLVHHTDLDMDATTALRFHFADMVVSAPYRWLQILIVGASPLAFSIWQTFMFCSILFHHSNLRLPIEIERKLICFVVTPRHHGIHHSIVREETDSNWSSGLTVWDWLHGTLRLDVPQSAIRIGVPAYRNSQEIELKETLRLPFVNQPESWRLPDGSRPRRAKQLTSELQA